MRKRLLPAAAAVIVAAGLVSLGAAAPAAPGADLSAALPSDVTAAVEEFAATGVVPADVSGEPGIWNFAGPAGTCPGPGWNCVQLSAFSLPLTQVGTVNVLQCVGPTCIGSTQTGYANSFECKAGECVVTQSGTSNQAKCDQKTSTTASFVHQRCSITQTGEDNQAAIVQVIEQKSSSVQGAVQEAGAAQTATASTNQLQVDQEIKQLTETGATQDQDAYQVVAGPFAADEPASDAATQSAAGAGDNQAQISQKQTQRAKGGTIQTQNDGATTFTAPDDCDPANDFSPMDPNACTNLEQTSGSGDNQSQLGQSIDAEATTNAPASQTQGSFAGGLDGRVHQVTTAPGSSANQADQSKLQRLFAPSGSTQFQFDPAGCCGIASQLGGSDNDEQIDQKSEQHASDGNAVQELVLWGTSNSPSGTCDISHDAKNNADETSESFSFEPCPPVLVQTICTSGPEEDDGPSIAQVGECTTFAPTDPTEIFE